jgi:hypothetical protein
MKPLFKGQFLSFKCFKDLNLLNYNLTSKNKIIMKTITASYGARVRGSVFKIKFKALAGEFESIETFPGFVQLLGEN